MEKNVFETNSVVSRFCGSADSTARFFTREALLDEALWKKFVQAFRDKTDGTNLGWRCEYWGKMMRGAAMIYEYSRDEALYREFGVSDEVKSRIYCDNLFRFLGLPKPEGV